jgi:hypothetical protein
MAEFMNEQEIQESIARLSESFRLGEISATQYNKEMKNATVGIRGYTAGLQASMAQLGTSFKQLGKDIYDGKQGAAVFNNTMDSGANAVAAYAMKFGPAGIALGAFTKAVSSFVGAANKQSDLLFDSYQRISRAGVVGAGAMKEVFDNMQRLGYTQDQLGDMGQVLAGNSKALAQFSRSAISGAAQFVDLAAEMQESGLRTQFFNLGMSVTDINQASAGYLIQLGRLGKSSQATAAGAADYIKEMETLTRLTGLTRQEMEAQREQAENIDSYFSLLQDLDPKKAETIRGTFDQLMAADPTGKRARAFAEVMGTVGIPMSAEALEFLQGTGFDAINIKQKILNGELTSSTDVMKALGVAFKEQMPIQKDLAGVQANYTGSLNSAQAIINARTKSEKEAADAVAAGMAGTEKTTASQAKLRNNQILQAQSLQSFVNMGVAPATAAMEIFTDVVEHLTSLLPGSGSAADRQLAKKTGQTVQQIQNQRATTNYGAGEFTGTPGMDSGAAPSTGSEGAAGLNLKPGAEQAGKSTDALYAAAQQVSQILGGNYKYFSGLRDRDGDSAHASGKAFDLVLNDPNGYEAALAQIKTIPGIKFAQFERTGQKNKNGSVATGDHIHAEVSAANGAILSGPASGYQPNLTMHGTEAVVPLNTAAQQAAAGMMDNGTMALQLGKLEEMVSLMKSQLSVSTRIMQYSS